MPLTAVDRISLTEELNGFLADHEAVNNTPAVEVALQPDEQALCLLAARLRTHLSQWLRTRYNT